MVGMKLVFVVFVSAILKTCVGYANPLKFIVGGQTTRPHQFPFLVSLRTVDNYHFCGAGILSDRWLLSAAHCTQETNSQPANVFAVIGAHHHHRDGQPFRIDTIVNHPKYNPNWMTNDICVIRTAQQITFIRGIVQPLRLPSVDLENSTHRRVWIAGWGRTSRPNPNENVFSVHPYLQFKAAITISRDECRQSLASVGLARYVHENKICTLTPEGQGICSGDYGGPLVDDNAVCVGIASWTYLCATSKPDVYTRTFPHLYFIVATTGVYPQ